MFQKEAITILYRSLLVAGLFIACLSSAYGAESAKLLSEKLLASVAIDDFVDSNRSREREESNASAAKAELENALEASTHAQGIPVEKVEFPLSERLVLEEVRFQIAKQFEITEDFRINFENPWQELKLDSVDWELVMTSFPSTGLRSRFYVSFELWVDGKRHSTWQEGVRCELWADAYVALQRIERGTVMRSELVAVKPVDRLNLFQGAVDIGTKLNDFVVVNGVKAGEPLFWRDLRERPLIEKNALIDVTAQEGMMKISLKAKALEDGVKGQVIRIRNLQSYNDIQAEVIGVNQARVYF